MGVVPTTCQRVLFESANHRTPLDEMANEIAATPKSFTKVFYELSYLTTSLVLQAIP